MTVDSDLEDLIPTRSSKRVKERISFDRPSSRRASAAAAVGLGQVSKSISDKKRTQRHSSSSMLGNGVATPKSSAAAVAKKKGRIAFTEPLPDKKQQRLAHKGNEADKTGRKSLGATVSSSSSSSLAMTIKVKSPAERFSGVISGADAETLPYCPSHNDLKAFETARDQARVRLLCVKPSH